MTQRRSSKPILPRGPLFDWMHPGETVAEEMATRTASRKSIPCLRILAWFLASSHSYPGGKPPRGKLTACCVLGQA